MPARSAASSHAATAPEAPVLDERIRAAVLACIGRYGLAKLTVDDIARAAGCSRASFYRAYASRRLALAAAVRAEADRVTDVLLGVIAAAPTLTDAITDVVVEGAREVRTSDALRFLAAHEPERLHPHLSFGGGDRFLRDAAARLAPGFARLSPEPYRVAEWTVRLALCLVWFPHPAVDVADRDAVRAYVETFVTPGLAARPHQEEAR